MKNSIGKFWITILTLGAINVLNAQFNTGPTVQWKMSTWAPKDVFGNTIVNQSQSGDEWWYSHKNLYSPTNPNVQIGYVGVGYAAYMWDASSFSALQSKFNE